MCRNRVYISIVLFIIGLYCSGCSFKTEDPDGPYQVGVTLKYVETEEREMKITVWYPGVFDSGAAPHTFQYDFLDKFVKTGTKQYKTRGAAVLDADPDPSGGPYPLIIFSAGGGATGDAYVCYAQNLASYGYVVMAPDHMDGVEGNFGWGGGMALYESFRILHEFTIQDPTDSVFILQRNWFVDHEFNMTFRPREIDLTIQQAEFLSQNVSSVFHNLIDTENIGITGHSIGATMALIKGGMPFLCDYEPDPFDCNIDRISVVDWDPCCTDTIKEMDEPYDFVDERIKAIVALAPPIFHKDTEIARNASEINTPLMIIAGDDPYLESTYDVMKEVYDNASGDKYYIQIRDCDHFVITEMANGSLKGITPPKNRSHFAEKATAYKDYSSAFFNKYLKGDQNIADILHFPNQKYVKNVWYNEK